MAGSLIVDEINGDDISGGFLGIGQTWQDVTTLRAFGTTYTNTTGRPIVVFLSADTNSSAATFNVVYNGTNIGYAKTYGTGYGQPFSLIVQPEDTYAFVGNWAATYWMELR